MDFPYAPDNPSEHPIADASCNSPSQKLGMCDSGLCSYGVPHGAGDAENADESGEAMRTWGFDHARPMRPPFIGGAFMRTVSLAALAATIHIATAQAAELDYAAWRNADPAGKWTQEAEAAVTAPGCSHYILQMSPPFVQTTGKRVRQSELTSGQVSFRSWLGQRATLIPLQPM